MRVVVLSAVLWLGCATTSTSSLPSEGGTSAPPPMPCVSADGCGPGLFCVKTMDMTEGACSTVPSASPCATNADCMAGSYCYKPPGRDGVCFKP